MMVKYINIWGSYGWLAMTKMADNMFDYSELSVNGDVDTLSVQENHVRMSAGPLGQLPP